MKALLFIFSFWFQLALAQNFIAQSLEASGDVRVKCSNCAAWRDLGDNELLNPGDLVFIGESAKLKLTYPKFETTVALNEEMIFKIENRPPLFTKFTRNFNGQTLEPIARPLGSKESNQTQNQTVQKSEKSSGNSELTVSRPVKRMNFVYPTGDFSLSTDRFPSSFHVILDKQHRGQKVWGYLWKKDNDKSPVWSGMSLGEFTDVVVPSRGVFIFQAISGDDVYATLPLEITAKQTGSSFIPDAPGDHTVLVQ